MGFAAQWELLQTSSCRTSPRGFWRTMLCYQVRPGNEQSFLSPLPVNWLPGVQRLFAPGWVQTATKMEELCLKLNRDVAAVRTDQLEMVFGTRARVLKQWSIGFDPSPVWGDSGAPSTEIFQTLERDEIDDDVILNALFRLIERLCVRVRQQNRSVGAITLFLQYTDGRDVAKTQKLCRPTQLESDIYPEIEKLFFSVTRRVRIRRIGLAGDPSRGPAQLNLFSSARSCLDGTGGFARESPGEEHTSVNQTGPLIMSMFVHLNVHSEYSAGSGVSSIESLCDAARTRGFDAIALTDTNGLYGAVRFQEIAAQKGLKAIFGAELEDNLHHRALVLVREGTGYANLCRLVSMRHEDARFDLIRNLSRYRDGLIIATDNSEIALTLKQQDPHNLYIEILPGKKMDRCLALSRTAALPPLATNRVHFTNPEDFPLCGVLVGNSTEHRNCRALPISRSSRSSGLCQRTFSSAIPALSRSDRKYAESRRAV